jgi:alkanesulfonate monooxygenase SsuD/methylene tetrahydromethanopterin reductase-like flavin-dependent oxidoreductase (luciferase family)
MEFGITLATAADSWKVVQRAETLGFTYAWFYDTQMLNADPFVAMAAAAMQTTTINLGTGVLVPSNRLAPVTANCLASLNKLAPGRIHFGIATGFTARRAMGLGAVKLDDMAEYIRIVQGLLKRETVTWDFEGRQRHIRFLNPELDLINTQDHIPLYISAFGPRSQALTAQLGAGWIYSMRHPEQSVDQLRQMQQAWRAAGRDPATLYAVAQASGCVLTAGEAYDSPKAKTQAGPSAVMILHDLVEAAEHRPLGYRMSPTLQPLLDAYRELYAQYEPADARYLQVHRWHLMKLRPEEQHLVTPELIKNLTFTGAKESLRQGIRTLREAGYAQFAMHIRYGHAAMLEEWAEVLSGV